MELRCSMPFGTSGTSGSRPSSPTSDGLVIAALFALLPACAWGYAGQREKDSEPTDDSDPTVVEVDDSASEDSDDSPASEAGCGVESFEIHLYDDSERVTKRISCSRREVLEVRRSPIAPDELEAARETGLPEDTWYLLVDPKGSREEFLTRDQLLEVSSEYDVQFLGRDKERELLIYEYTGTL